MSEFHTLSADHLTDEQILCLRDQAINQHRWARQYSLQLIDTVPQDLWYKIPPGMFTHLAWQVGHLAVSQYGLMLFRQRGRAEADLELMPGWLRKQFGRGSQPAVCSESSPTPAQLIEKLERIHQQSISEASQLSAGLLRESCELPYCVYPIKLGALQFAAIHESLHAGQIGLVRRGLGLDPVR